MADPSRRAFLWTATATAASAIVVARTRGVAAQPAGLTATQLTERLRDKLGVPRREGSSDGFKAGNPDALVTGVATTVMATADVLRRAAAAGRNVVVTQE